MSRENAAAKAARLLVQGRLVVRRIEDDVIVATVRGDSAAVYTVEAHGASWSCDCAARSRCSHIRATQLVVLTRGGGPDG